MAKNKKYNENIGQKYGKPDIERIGLFAEMPFMNGTRYVSPYTVKQAKGLNMMCEGTKSRNGTSAGYFGPFERLFIGEGHGRIGKFKLSKGVAKPFLPAGVQKKHACPGDYFGTFSGNIEAFSRVKRKEPPYKREPRNMGTSPPKKGGPGYPDICLNPYPEYKGNKYDFKPKYKEYGNILGRAMVTVHRPRPYFAPNPYKLPPDVKDGPTFKKLVKEKHFIVQPGYIMPVGPAKWQGGSHAGCFSKFPEHKPEKYNPPTEKKKKSGVFYPQSMGEKSYFTESVINRNLSFRVNIKNYIAYEPSYTKYLLQ